MNTGIFKLFHDIAKKYFNLEKQLDPKNDPIVKALNKELNAKDK